jgi:hypothetical protein
VAEATGRLEELEPGAGPGVPAVRKVSP